MHIGGHCRGIDGSRTFLGSACCDTRVSPIKRIFVPLGGGVVGGEGVPLVRKVKVMVAVVEGWDGL